MRQKLCETVSSKDIDAGILEKAETASFDGAERP